MPRQITRRVSGVCLAASLGLSGVLVGCGQKGPLYLPDEAPKASPTAPAPSPAQPASLPSASR